MKSTSGPTRFQARWDEGKMKVGEFGVRNSSLVKNLWIWLLTFTMLASVAGAETPKQPLQTLTIGGGCFWCLEAIFQEVRGVEKVTSGFSGGHVVDPSYHDVCTGTTGHAETVQISFRPDVVSRRELLDMFFVIHDPTSLNRQGDDEGPQYRSVVFYHDAEEKAVAEAAIKAAQKDYKKPIVTELTPFKVFYPAEGYHQNYYKSNPHEAYCSMVISPKVKKFRQRFASKLKAL